MRPFGFPRWPFRSAKVPAVESGPTPPDVPSLFAYLISDLSETVVSGHSGSGDSIAAPSGNTQVLTDAAGLFVVSDARQRVNIAGASDPADNGDFWVTATAATQLVYWNPTGVGDSPYNGTWTLPGKYSQLIDLENARAFVQATDASRPAATLFGAFSCAGKGLTATAVGLSYADAAVAAFDGVDVSCSMRVYMSLFIGGTNTILSEISNGAGNALRFSVATSLPNTVLRLTWVDSGGTTTLSSAVAGLALNTWFTLGWKLNRTARTLTSYVNGVNIGTSAAGTSRNPTGLARADLFTTLTGNSSSAMIASGAAWAPAAWSDADFLAVHNSFLAYGVPT